MSTLAGRPHTVLGRWVPGTLALVSLSLAQASCAGSAELSEWDRQGSRVLSSSKFYLRRSAMQPLLVRLVGICHLCAMRMHE